MKEKGFTYIIIVVIIMIMVTMLFLISGNISYKENKSKTIVANYENELKSLIVRDINAQSLDILNTNFREYIKSNNYNSKICNIYFNGENYLLSNYQDLNYSIINENQTISILEEEITENIVFGECELDISTNKKLTYYIEIYNGNEKRVAKE